MSRVRLRTAAVIGVLLVLGLDGPAIGAKMPNVVFIVVDDLGWADLRYAGSDYYETPNVDQLTKESLVFRSAYAAAPVCSPTRAALMTGKSPARLDMTIWHEGAVAGGPRNRKLLPASAVANLPREEVTMAELFQRAGYFTAHVGKWHLGTAAYYPETQGFDLNVGGTFWGAPSTFFYPFSGKWNDRDPEIRYVPGIRDASRGDYLPDKLTDAALEIIEQRKDKPFFLNLWYYTVHSPVEAPSSLVDRFAARKAVRHQRDPTYAAMVHRMDHNVGRVLKKLDELKLTDDTIVVFTSDNGGVDFDQRSIVPTSNLPLRSGKGTLYEGGIRIPLLVRWPGKVVGETRELCTSQDFFLTFAEMLGTHLDTELDGVSLMPLLNDAAARLPERALFWHFPHYYPRMTPGSAIRSGDWKLIYFYEDERRELYNLRSDPGEQMNLATANPEASNQLFSQLENWMRAVEANRPTPNPMAK